MKTRVIAVLSAALVLVAALAGPCAAQGAKTGGQIVNDKGETIQVVEFINLVNTLPVVYAESDEQVPLADVKSLTRTDDGMIMLENIAGKSFKVTMPMVAISNDAQINFKAQDPISGQVNSATIDGAFVNRIVFNH